MKLSSDNRKKAITATAIIGLFSSILSLITTDLSKSNLWVGATLFLVTIIIVFVILYLIPKDNLPTGLEAVADEMDNKHPKQNMKIVFPCDNAYYKEANKLAKEKFGKNSVSTKTVNDWQKRNEYILTCLTDSNRMVGYFDILPLKEDFANKLIAGDVSETEIRAEHILAFHEIKHAQYVYFAGIAVQNPDSGYGCIHGTYLIYAAMLYIKLFYSHGNLKKILTIPTSECGMKIAKHLNFNLEREGRLRKDGFDIFSKDFHAEELNELIKEKKQLYNRFDSSAYSHTIKVLTA